MSNWLNRFVGRRRGRIPCLMLIYENVDIIRCSIEAIAGLVDHIELWVIENPSANSEAIREFLHGYLRNGLLSRCFLFDENISNNAIELVLRRELEYSARRRVLVTDGDLLPLNPGWLDEELTILDAYSEVFCVGGTLDMANLPLATFPEAGGWIPADRADHGGYIETTTGIHFLMFRADQLAAMTKHLGDKCLRFRDDVIAEYCYRHLGARWARTRHARFVHLTWNLYQDVDHPYTRFKRDIPFESHWNHNRYAGYRCCEYRFGYFRERRVAMSATCK